MRILFWGFIIYFLVSFRFITFEWWFLVMYPCLTSLGGDILHPLGFYSGGELLPIPFVYVISLRRRLSKNTYFSGVRYSQLQQHQRNTLETHDNHQILEWLLFTFCGIHHVPHQLSPIFWMSNFLTKFSPYSASNNT